MGFSRKIRRLKYIVKELLAQFIYTSLANTA
ncbi:hypothetical protein NYA8BAC_01781 [Psychrobacter okhotskensis]